MKSEQKIYLFEIVGLMLVAILMMAQAIYILHTGTLPPAMIGMIVEGAAAVYLVVYSWRHIYVTRQVVIPAIKC